MTKYLFMDVDGSITDGKIYIGNTGELMKAFSVKDGYAINHILKEAGIEPVIITARESEIVTNRASELGISNVYQGVCDKLETIYAIAKDNNLAECAYFGDDILDLVCMDAIKKSGGIVGCPADAVSEVRAVADYVSNFSAGNGAFREFAEWLVGNHIDENDIKTRVNYAIEYLKRINSSDMEPGKYVVNDKFYYSIQEYNTKEEEQCPLESHRKYIDIQMIVSGCEVMQIADVSRLMVDKKYDEKIDIMFWKKPLRMQEVTLSPESIIVLYPENAHSGCIMTNQSVKVRKIVGKVRCN